MTGRVVVAILCVLSLSSTTEPASKKVRQPTREDLATVWVGGCGGSLECYRLELDIRGIGLLTVQDFPDGPVAAYEVARTALSGYAVTLETTPIEAAEPLQIRGEATPTSLRLEVRGRAADGPAGSNCSATSGCSSVSTLSLGKRRPSARGPGSCHRRG